MLGSSLYTRFVQPRLVEALTDSPVVLVHGPRQCGKTTLARMISDAAGYAYISFDDDIQRNAATSDPVGFVGDLGRKVILDEVQRVPELFTTLKAAVDRDRTPGRFILTGSANVLLLPNLADSLAGRMEILRLHPLAQTELAGKESGFLDALFQNGFRSGPHSRLGKELPVSFYHFRDKDGVEVDFVLEGSGQRLAGIEVKASATVTAADFRGLKKLKESSGEQFAAGVVLYDGESAVPFGDKLFAVPVRCIWE